MEQKSQSIQEDVAILRNYVFDGVGNAALDRLVEQYENAMKLALKGQTREAEIMRLQEQLEAVQRQRDLLLSAAQIAEDAIRVHGRGVPLITARHKLYAAMSEVPSPASEPEESNYSGEWRYGA